MKILITGANGYIGTGVVSELCKNDVEVVATDFFIDGISPEVEVIKGDIFSIENPYEYFKKPDIVIHLAWRNGFVHNSESHIEDFSKHYMFLKKLAESGISKIVVLGSMHEIGFYEGRIDENTPCNPMSLYGIAKNSLRSAVKMLCDANNVKFQWIRGFYIIGNSEKGASIFSKITKAEKEGQKEFPFTSGVNQYDFIKYEEFCRQIVSITLQDNILGIINACSGKPKKLSEAVEQFIKDNKYKITLKYGVYPDRPYDSLAVWGDNTKIEAILKNEDM